MKRLAFTLIEILIVIVVIGIISSFIIVSMSSITSKATIAKGQAFSSSIKNALMSNLVSEWKLDESSGTTAYDSWSSKNGTIVNAPTIVSSCPQNSCYSFNGTSQYITIPDDPVFSFGTKMSAFVWAKGTQSGTNVIFGQYDSASTPNKRVWYIARGFSTLSNKLLVRLSSNGGSIFKSYYTNSVIFDGNWHLVGFTWDGTIADDNLRLKLYVDGVEITDLYKEYNTAMTNLYNADCNLTIGCALGNGSPTALFAGQIDEARVYNETIPVSLIEQNYYSGLNKLLSYSLINNREYNQRLAIIPLN